MDNPRPEKVAVVTEVRERLEGADGAILTEYRGLNVHAIGELRRALRAAGGEYKIYKNTLVRLAAADLGLLDSLESMLEGPTAIAYVTGDVAKVAKDIADFAKKAPALVLKGGVFEGQVLSAQQAKALSTLESREVMLSKVASMAITPLQLAANLFAAGFNRLGAVLAQHRDNLSASEAA